MQGGESSAPIPGACSRREGTPAVGYVRCWACRASARGAGFVGVGRVQRSGAVSVGARRGCAAMEVTD